MGIACAVGLSLVTLLDSMSKTPMEKLLRR
jgi:hypothetical protein